jgi:hypothetical protein
MTIIEVFIYREGRKRDREKWINGERDRALDRSLNGMD